MVVAFRHLLDGVFLQSDVSDRWKCDSDILGGYTVRGAYQILDNSGLSLCRCYGRSFMA